MIKKIKFDKKKLKFYEIVNEHFYKKFRVDFKNLHLNAKVKKLNLSNRFSSIDRPVYKFRRNYFNVKKDQANYLIEYFYKIDPYFNLGSKKKNKGKFINTYEKLIFFLQEEYFKHKIIFQKRPTLRIHLNDTISVGGYHRDSDYGHPKESINFWLPFCDTKKTNTLWLESKKNLKDFKPKKMQYGEILTFDSSLKHGVELNKENTTRISMDFRVMRKKDYKNFNSFSPKNNIRFNLGNYYDEF